MKKCVKRKCIILRIIGGSVVVIVFADVVAVSNAVYKVYNS